MLLGAAAGCREPNCSSTSTPVALGVDAALDGDLHALEDQLLGVGDRLGLLRASDRPRSRTSSSGTSRGGRRRGCRACRRSRAPWVTSFVATAVSAVRPGYGYAAPWSRTSPARATRSGIEEELMILDAETLGAGQRDRGAARGGGDDDGDDQARAARVGARDRHASPRRTRREAGAQLRGAAPPGRARPPAQRGLTIGSAGTHPFAMWEDQRDRRAAALPRPDRDAALRRAPGAHLRPARPRRASTTPTRRSTSPTGCACTSRCCSRCRPTRRSGAATRPGWPPPARRSSARSRASASRPPTTDWDDFERRIGFMVDSRRDRGLHLPLVRRPPAPELRHGRDPRDGRPDARRAHARRSRR